MANTNNSGIKNTSNKISKNNKNNKNNKNSRNNKNSKKGEKVKKKTSKKGSKKVKALKKEILRLKLNQEDLQKKHNRLKKVYFLEKEDNKKKTEKIKRMLSTSDKIIPSLKDLKNNILVSYQTFEQLNTLLGQIYLEKETPPKPKKKI